MRSQSCPLALKESSAPPVMAHIRLSTSQGLGVSARVRVLRSTCLYMCVFGVLCVMVCFCVILCGVICVWFDYVLSWYNGMSLCYCETVEMVVAVR